MICFRDMTFCNAKCINTDCQRKLTDKVLDDAARWWGSVFAPISVADMSENCEQYLPKGVSE